MTYARVQAGAMAAATADVAEIGWAVGEAKAAAASPTTNVAAAADEVSAATATLFNTYARDYQALLNDAATFHGEFAQALAAAGSAYANTEAAASGALEALLAPLTGGAATGGATATATAAIDPGVALIMSGTNMPTPSPDFITAVYNNYIAPNFPVPSGNVQGLTTPEGLYPFTGVKDLTLDTSVARGVAALTSAIQQQLAIPGINSVVVSGYSQGAIVASLAMPQLVAEHVPSSAVDFVLLGNPMNPNGGLFERFVGLSLPSLGLTYYGATPSNSYPTVTYTLEYDPFADFPQYPINPLSDLNALMGLAFVHGWYPYIDPGALPPGYSITTLPMQGPTMSTYGMITVPNLPLLDPLRVIPYVGNPLADLLQGPLAPLVNWGYGDPAHGYSTGPANVPTPFGLLPPLSATTALGPAVVSGTQQGIVAAYSDFHAEGLPSLPALPVSVISQALPSGPPAITTLPPPTSPASAITDILSILEAANSTIVGGLTNAFSAAGATLLPTADFATAIAFSLPSYDVNLFLNGITQAVNGQPLTGLANAIGDPIIANLISLPMLGLGELTVLGGAGYQILTGTQLPFADPAFPASLPPWVPAP